VHGLDGLVVPHDLGGRCGWHGREEEAVAHPVLLDLDPQRVPVLASRMLDVLEFGSTCLVAPQVELEFSL